MMTNQFLIILIVSLTEMVLHCRSKPDTTYLTASVGDAVTLPCFSNYSDPADWKFRPADGGAEHRVSSRGKTVNGFRCRFNLDANKNKGSFSLTIADVQKDDAGLYRCVEDGEFGSAQYVHLNVSGIRHIYARKDTKVTRVGCRVWLGCYSSSQYPTGWNRRTTEGQKRNSTKLRVDTITDNVREFVVKRANLSDSGTYTCVDRQDRRDKTLRHVDLFVVADESDVKEMLAAVGHTFNLTCHKKPQSTVQWKHKHLPWQVAKGVNPSGKYQVFNDHETSVLQISEITDSESGLYVCSESYDLEPSRSTGSFVVSVPPSCITTCPRDVVAVSGTDVILSASTSNANDDCHWGRFNDSSRLPNNIFAEGILHNKRYDVIDYHPGQLDLAIKNVSVEDAGTYMFKDDLCNNEETTAKVSVLQGPPTCKPIELKDAHILYECVVNFGGNVQMKVTCREENGTHQLNATLNPIPDGYAWTLPVRSSVLCTLSADIFACEKRVSAWSFDIIITTNTRAAGFSNASIGLGTTGFVIIVLAIVTGLKILVSKIRKFRTRRKQRKEQPSMLPLPDSIISHGDCRSDRTPETKSSERFLADYGKDKEADGENGTQVLWHLNNPQQHNNRDLKSNDYLDIPAGPQKSNKINDSSDTSGYVNVPGGRGSGCASAENYVQISAP